MKFAPRPVVTIADVLSSCTRYGRIELNGRFKKSHASFQELEEKYREALEKEQLSSLLPTMNSPALFVTSEEMVALYENRMVKESSSGSVIYGVLQSTNNNRCTYCDMRDATTLDHYIPKEAFPQLSFLPLNLVPACSVCNGRKGTYVAKVRADELLHPYFDDLGDYQWVDATVADGSPVPTFRILAPVPTFGQRVNGHFIKFRLAESYATKAQSEWRDLHSTLTSHLGASPTPDAVRAFLIRTANGSKNARSRNNWRAVCYKAWALSDWFVAGGYKFTPRQVGRL